MHWVVLAFLIFLAGWVSAEPFDGKINDAPHLYLERTLADPFTRLKNEIESGRVQLDHSSTKAFLRSLLRALEVPEETQALVFSTTSLQGNLITPSNPRALYFNEEVYVGFIPGGKIEVISLDPDLGGIFYIFPIPRVGERLAADRSGRCMSCHTAADSRYVPGLVIESVVNGPNGGTLDAFRREQNGHQIPYELRFGGWYVTGQGAMTNHWGNVTGRMRDGEITKEVIEPGKRFDFGKYLTASSDLLAHLLLEHQIGFVNRVLEATYRTRALLHLGRQGQLASAQEKELDGQARELVRYILFAGEPVLPDGGIEGGAALKKAFLAARRVASNGRALRDLDLRDRLFANRCSYMVYSPIFTALPAEMKNRVFRELNAALTGANSDYAYLPPAEKQSIRTILEETLPGFAVQGRGVSQGESR